MAEYHYHMVNFGALGIWFLKFSFQTRREYLYLLRQTRYTYGQDLKLPFGGTQMVMPNTLTICVLGLILLVIYSFSAKIISIGLIILLPFTMVNEMDSYYMS